MEQMADIISMKMWEERMNDWWGVVCYHAKCWLRLIIIEVVA